MIKKEWPYLAIAVAALAFTFFAKLGALPIRIWDEGRLAVSALYMHLHGLSLVPYYDGAPDLWSVKPPLVLWLQALSMKVFGMNEFAVRLPAALSSLVTGLLLYRAGRRLHPAAGLLSALVFATTYGFVYGHAGRFGEYDAPLTLAITVYALAIWRFADETSARRIYVAGVALSAAVLIKGVAGLLFVPGLLLYLLLRRRLLPLLRLRATWLSLLFFLVVTGGYYLLRERINPGYLQAVWDNELGGRFLSALEEHAHPFGWYLENMFSVRYSFWAPFLVSAFIVGFACRDARVRALSQFVACATLPFLLIISSARTKLDWYDLPLYPFFALQIGATLYIGWEALRGQLHGTEKIPVRPIAAALLAACLFLVPYTRIYQFIYRFTEQPWEEEPHRAGYFLQSAIRNHNKQLDFFAVCYSGYNAQIQFYVHALNAQNVPLQLTNDFQKLWLGQHVLVCQEPWRRVADSLGFQKVDEQFGCTEYIVTKVP